MITSRMNPKVKFYSQSQTPSKIQHTWELIENVLKSPLSKIKRQPDFIGDHRKYMMSSYRKKLD